MGRVASPVLLRFFDTYAAGTPAGVATETTLQFPAITGAGGNQSQNVLLLSFHFVRAAGTGATYTPRLGEIATFAAGSIGERMVYAATAVATPINDVFSQPIPMRTDANGRLYFRPAFDAGADNTAAWEFFFQVCEGGSKLAAGV